MTSSSAATLETLISGGQTGADRAALDAGLAMGIAVAGACPKGRLAADGAIDSRYPLTEIGGGYRQRTKHNIVHSDATVLFYRYRPEGGTETTLALCIKLKSPYLLIDTSLLSAEHAADAVSRFVSELDIQALNVAGPRESRCPGIYDYVFKALRLATTEHG